MLDSHFILSLFLKIFWVFVIIYHTSTPWECSEESFFEYLLHCHFFSFPYHLKVQRLADTLPVI